EVLDGDRRLVRVQLHLDVPERRFEHDHWIPLLGRRGDPDEPCKHTQHDERSAIHRVPSCVRPTRGRSLFHTLFQAATARRAAHGIAGVASACGRSGTGWPSRIAWIVTWCPAGSENQTVLRSSSARLPSICAPSIASENPGAGTASVRPGRSVTPRFVIVTAPPSS